MQAAWGTAFLGIVGAGFIGWCRAIAKWRVGQSPVPWNSRRHVPWALADLFLFALVFLVASMLMGAALASLGWPLDKPDGELTLREEQLHTLAIAVVPLVVLMAGAPLLAFRSGARTRDFGWSAGHCGDDVKLGLAAFVMLAPPVFALQAALVQFWPSEHPLMEMFKRTPDSNLFALLIVAAVIVAPVFEEFVFRVLLQGFLEKAVSFRGQPWELLVGTPQQARDGPVVEAEIMAEDVEDAADLEGGTAAQPINPYLAPLGAIADDTAILPPSGGDAEPLTGLAAYGPIAISSVVFAALHWQHGPDWIPLTLLAVGMGYVYQRTHRIVPSLVVHVALNAFSMWGLWVQVRGG